jgi:hypothetical protein
MEDDAGLEERVAHFALALRWMESFEFVRARIFRFFDQPFAAPLGRILGTWNYV